MAINKYDEKLIKAIKTKEQAKAVSYALNGERPPRKARKVAKRSK